MARICDRCGKKRDVGHNVSHAKNRTRRIRNPNLHTYRMPTPNGKMKLRLCTKCLRTVKRKIKSETKPVVAVK